MNKGVKFRAYPNKEQQNLINRTLGCCRLIYNKGLAMRSVSYSNGEKIGYNQTSAMLTDLKKQADFAFLKDVDSIALQQSLRDLDRGFKNYFDKRARHPPRRECALCRAPHLFLSGRLPFWAFLRGLPPTARCFRHSPRVQAR